MDGCAKGQEGCTGEWDDVLGVPGDAKQSEEGNHAYYKGIAWGQHEADYGYRLVLIGFKKAFFTTNVVHKVTKLNNMQLIVMFFCLSS